LALINPDFTGAAQSTDFSGPTGLSRTPSGPVSNAVPDFSGGSLYGLLNPGTTLPGTTTPTPAPAPSPGQKPSSVNPDLSYLDPYGTVSGGYFTPWGGSAGPIPGPPNTGAPNVGGQQATNTVNSGGFAGNPDPYSTITDAGGLGDLLNAFPGYQNALAQQQEGLAGADANLNAERARLIIQFGDPALAQMAGFGLDPQAAAFAQQNYLSGNATLARLDKQHQLAQRAIVNQLVAHGLLNSGDLGYDQGQENQAYGNNVYDAQQSVLGQLAQLYNSYLGTRASLGDAVNNAMNSALAAFLSNPDAYASYFGGSTPKASSTPNGSSLAPAKTTKAKAPADALSRYLANRT
jgi:hypothetical protein